MIHLITGAGASGKSEYAENLAISLFKEVSGDGKNYGNGGSHKPMLYYVATMMVQDEESRQRVMRHRQMRSGKGFETIEQPTDIASLPVNEKNAVVLLEDLSNLLANEMYGPDGSLENLSARVTLPILRLGERINHLIIVTNEIFTGTDDKIDFTREFADLNREIAARAESFVEVVDGIGNPIRPKANHEADRKTNHKSDRKANHETNPETDRKALHHAEIIGEMPMKLVFITGGIYQGKTEYAKKNYADGPVIDDLDLRMKEAMQKAETCGENFSSVEWVQHLLAEQSAPRITVIGCENGCGLVPMDAFLRRYREENGRMNAYLAGQADCVIRMICGLPQILKQKQTKRGRVLLIRHGATAGNLRKCFVGSTDEPLCPSGIEDLKQLKSNVYDAFLAENPEYVLFASPMTRCRQTAGLIFPEREPEIVNGLRECDFGIMDGKNHEEMMENPEYRAFIEAENPVAFPGGENMEGFLDRCADAFSKTIFRSGEIFERQENPLFVFVVHGGTCMGILNRHSDQEKAYYEWNPQNGKGYLADLETDLQDTLKLRNIRLLPEE